MTERAIRGLLIEDDADDALLFMDHMKSVRGTSQRFAFERARSLKEGLAVLARGGVEIVLLDVMLPDGRGIETLHKLREGFPDVPVVVLTGLADEAIGIEALRLGAQDYQVKGTIEGHSLKRTISYAVERHRMLTELRRAELLKAEIKEREALDKLKDELMGTVSHEMRNPLSVIKVVANGLQDALKDTLTRQQADMLAMQQRNIRRLEKIVGRILDLSRLESGKAEIAPQRIDAPQCVGDIVEGFRLVGRKPKIEIAVQLSTDLPAVFADPDLFVQVLNNLIDNAVRYAHSHIDVRAEIDAGGPPAKPGKADASGSVLVMTARQFLRFSVSDDGPGIPQDRIPDLFNKFVQVNRSAKGAGYKGTGLGLAICKEIVERHGGRIWVESAEGLGSAFRFTLPAYAPERA